MLPAFVILALLSHAPAAHAQARPGATINEFTISGTVVSSTNGTLIVRTDDGEYHVFAFDGETLRPATIPDRARVTVEYIPTDGDWAPIADSVEVTAPPAQGLAPPPEEPVPPVVRELERDVLREARRYRIGVRGGTTLDPELFLIGVHSQLGPFFTDRIWARPNLELGFGEVTTLVALNFEGAYYLPIAPRGGRWRVYAGGGPSLNFAKLGFSVDDDPDSFDVDERDRFDFDDLELDMGFNFILGMQARGGTFFELKSTAYSSPRVRFEVGRSF